MRIMYINVSSVYWLYQFSEFNSTSDCRAIIILIRLSKQVHNSWTENTNFWDCLVVWVLAKGVMVKLFLWKLWMEWFPCSVRSHFIRYVAIGLAIANCNNAKNCSLSNYQKGRTTFFFNINTLSNADKLITEHRFKLCW